jgi:hypothetical protein
MPRYAGPLIRPDGWWRRRGSPGRECHVLTAMAPWADDCLASEIDEYVAAAQ